MTQVRIHLNLHTPRTAESSIQVRDPDGNWRIAGYASGIVLDNVEPVVHEQKRQMVCRTGKKTPCAFLQGDLVEWTGRLRDGAAAESLAALEEKQKPRLSREYINEMDAQGSRLVNFNPKSAPEFYDHQARDNAFEKGDRLVAVNWAYAVTNPRFHPMPEMEVIEPEEGASQSSGSNIADGRKTTQSSLERLGKGHLFHGNSPAERPEIGMGR